jgi:hypothetical protein
MGRDHGLAGYLQWLRRCNHNLTQPISPSLANLLHKIYTYVYPESQNIVAENG